MIAADQKLLELAAKAIGVEFTVLNGQGARLARKPGVIQPYVPWDPLEDDGDALRLAMDLKLDIHQVDCDPPTAFWIDNSGELHSEIVSDHYTATRRAITRAAAEIGKAMTDAAPHNPGD